jgi:hypothetical protein
MTTVFSSAFNLILGETRAPFYRGGARWLNPSAACETSRPSKNS